METKNLYNKIYYQRSRKFQTNSGRTEKIVDTILKYKHDKVLDVGCGLASVVHLLRDNGVNAYGVDFAKDLEEVWGKTEYLKISDAKNLPYPDQEFDLVLSSDFFEHIPEEEIDQVVSEMNRVGKKVIALVADDIGEILNLRQQQYHCTHKPLDWWKEKLKGVDVYSSHDYEA